MDVSLTSHSGDFEENGCAERAKSRHQSGFQEDRNRRTIKNSPLSPLLLSNLYHLPSLRTYFLSKPNTYPP